MHDSPSPGPGQLVLVLSSERSGSTLLRVMLGEHSRVVAPSELFLMRYPDYDTWRRLKPVAIESLAEYFTLLGRPTTAADIDAQCRGWQTATVYEWMLGALPPGSLLIDKTPAYANNVATLARSQALTPFYIWLVRHPLGVIDSHLRIKDRERRAAAGSTLTIRRTVLRPLRDAVERLAGGMTVTARAREVKWVLQNATIRAFLSQVPAAQQAFVRFEALVRDPQPVMRALCAALGIEPEEGVLRPRTRGRVMNPQLGDPNFHQHDRIDAQPAERWTERFHEHDLSTETLQLLRQIGVPMHERERWHHDAA
jgi:Sulfotransferase family